MPVRGRGHDQGALALAERAHQVHHARRDVLRRRLQPDALLRVERGQVVEEDLLLRLVRRLEVDRVHLDQREVALVLLGRADLAGDGVAGAQVELADLRRRDVDVVRSRQVAVFGRAQEAEAVGQDLQHALREDQALLLGLGAQDLEDQLLLLHGRGAGDLQRLGHRGQLRDVHLLEVGEVEAVARVLGGAAVGRTAGPVGRGDRRRAALRPETGAGAACAGARGLLVARRSAACGGFDRGAPALRPLPRPVRRRTRRSPRRRGPDRPAARPAGAPLRPFASGVSPPLGGHGVGLAVSAAARAAPARAVAFGRPATARLVGLVVRRTKGLRWPCFPVSKKEEEVRVRAEVGLRGRKTGTDALDVRGKARRCQHDSRSTG